MTPSSLLGSWIDVEAAASLARDLCPPDPASPAPAETGAPEVASTSFLPAPAHSGASEPPATPPPQLTGRLEEIRERARRNGLLEKTPAVPPATRPVQAPGEMSTAAPVSRPAPEPFLVPLGPLGTRLRAFADWVEEGFAPDAHFVADEQGRALVDFRGSEELLAASSLLAEAAQRARKHLPDDTTTAVIHVPIGKGRTLTLVSSETLLGRWNAGILSRAEISPEGVRLVARALKKAAEPDTTSRTAW